VHIPKPDGRTRPLGIPALEDKIVQQAVRMILEPIYEQAFLGFSYGYRPGRSQHDALDALATVIVKKRTNWVLDADVRAFFDSVDHGWMKKFLEHRIADSRLVRLVMKWLRAGVMEEGQLHEVQEGTPQGGIISPLLANIYLHYVVDLWVHQWRKRNARQEVYVVRYADDLVVGCEDGRDARSLRAALAQRLRAFGLELHPDKTRILRFGRYARERCQALGLPVETFDFLGFTHAVGADKKHGWFQLRRLTSRKKRQAKLAELHSELRRRRHEDARITYAWLSSVLRGHYNYYGVPTNEAHLERFRRHVGDAWLRQLRRRSQRPRRWTLARVQRFEKRFPLPKPEIRHPWPEQRFVAR
jgi:RNA-directed DNA polymerase